MVGFAILPILLLCGLTAATVLIIFPATRRAGLAMFAVGGCLVVFGPLMFLVMSHSTSTVSQGESYDENSPREATQQSLERQEESLKAQIRILEQAQSQYEENSDARRVLQQQINQREQEIELLEMRIRDSQAAAEAGRARRMEMAPSFWGRPKPWTLILLAVLIFLVVRRGSRRGWGHGAALAAMIGLVFAGLFLLLYWTKSSRMVAYPQPDAYPIDQSGATETAPVDGPSPSVWRGPARDGFIQTLEELKARYSALHSLTSQHIDLDDSMRSVLERRLSDTWRAMQMVEFDIAIKGQEEILRSDHANSAQTREAEQRLRDNRVALARLEQEQLIYQSVPPPSIAVAPDHTFAKIERQIDDLDQAIASLRAHPFGSQTGGDVERSGVITPLPPQIGLIPLHDEPALGASDQAASPGAPPSPGPLEIAASISTPDRPSAEPPAAEAVEPGAQQPATTQIAPSALRTPIELPPESGPRPNWVDAPPKRIGPVYQRVVAAGPYVSQQEIDERLDSALFKATQDYLGQIVIPTGQGRSIVWDLQSPAYVARAGITPEYIRANLCADEYEESSQHSVGVMKTAYVLLQIDQDDKQDMVRRLQGVRQYVATSLVAIAMGVCLALLLVTFGYLKIDTLTKGYYSLRLKVLAVAMILGIGFVTMVVLDAVSPNW